MRRPRLLIGLFLLATVLVDLAALAIRPDMGVPVSERHYVGLGDEVIVPATASRYVGTLVWGLYLSQISAAAIWLALGLGAAPLRFIVVFFIILAWNGAILHLTEQSGDFGFGMEFMGMMAVAVTAPLLTGRLFGLRLALWHNGNLSEISPLGAERWQFSLLYLFGLMTVLAAFLGMLKFIFESDTIWKMLREHLKFVVTEPQCQWSIGLHAIVAWCALWIALGSQRWLRLGLAIALIAAILGICFGWSRYAHWHDDSFRWLYFGESLWWHSGWRRYDCGPLTVTAFFLLEAALLVGSLWIFRLAGYRVVFRRSVAEAVQAVDERKSGS
jgi:hypothetical protein